MENNGTPGNDLPMLLEAYLRNRCSKQQLAQLTEWAKDGSDELFDALKVHWAKARAENGPDQTRRDELFRALMKRAKEADAAATIQPVAATPPPVRQMGGTRRLWVRLAAAAVLVLFVSGTYFLLKKDEKVANETLLPVPVVKDVLPGGDRAVLTLADGRQIVLDTAANGALAREGGIRVMKVGGQLTYDAEAGSAQVLYNTITTPRGGQYQVELADGTNVWLNAASSLRFPTAFAGKERTVELSGEGYFEVAHNPSVPFFVKLGDVAVQVLGTHFNVNAYSDEDAIKTTLLEGRVKVTRNDRHVFLNPGQQAQAQAAGSEAIQIKNGVDVEATVAWKNGLFQLDGADVKIIGRQLARWYDVDVRYSGNLQSAHLSGEVPRNLSLSQVIKVLETSGIDVKIDGRNLTVTPKP